eukprot:COSAG01_NODE_2373_length_7809_cov_20.194034_5_plen_138_part_00
MVVVQCLSVRMVWLMVVVSVCVTVDGWPLVFAGLVWPRTVPCLAAVEPKAQPAGPASRLYEYGVRPAVRTVATVRVEPYHSLVLCSEACLHMAWPIEGALALLKAARKCLRNQKEHICAGRSDAPVNCTIFDLSVEL